MDSKEEQLDLRKNFVCIKFPGIVKNFDNAIKSLGGIDNISKAHSSKSGKLELRFRPDDPYCKPAIGTRKSSFGVLLKVKYRKKIDSTDDEIVKILSTEVVGTSDTMYTFERMADFQFLPVVHEENGPSRSLLNDLVPKGLVGPEWLDKPQDYFLVPPIFSRIDVPQNYGFRFGKSNNEKVSTCMRKTRSKYVHYLSFNINEPIPTKPHKDSVQNLQHIKKEHLTIITKLFEEKQIWSKVALMCITKVPNDALKNILPNVAYYYLSGPWRALWIKFGYDPRKDPQSRIYQSVDFRARSICIKDFLKIADVNSVLNKDKNENQEKIYDERYYIFRPGIIPPKMQMFYQYCYLKVPEIEDMLLKLDEIPPGALCHERQGWMPYGFDSKCRSYIGSYVIQKLREMRAEIYGNTSSAYDIDDEENFEPGEEEPDDYAEPEFSDDEDSNESE